MCVRAGYEVVSDTCAALYPTLIPLWHTHTHTHSNEILDSSVSSIHTWFIDGGRSIFANTHARCNHSTSRTHTLHMNTQPYATLIMCQADKHTHRNDSRLYSGVCLPPLPRMPRSTRLARIITGLPLIWLQHQQQLFLKARAENRQPMHNTHTHNHYFCSLTGAYAWVCVYVYIKAWTVETLYFLFSSLIVIL